MNTERRGHRTFGRPPVCRHIYIHTRMRHANSGIYIRTESTRTSLIRTTTELQVQNYRERKEAKIKNTVRRDDRRAAGAPRGSRRTCCRLQVLLAHLKEPPPGSAASLRCSWRTLKSLLPLPLRGSAASLRCLKRQQVRPEAAGAPAASLSTSRLQSLFKRISQACCKYRQ